MRHGAAIRVTDDLSWHLRCKFNGRSRLVRATTISAAFGFIPMAVVWMILAPGTVTSSQAPTIPRPVLIAAPVNVALPPDPPLEFEPQEGTVDLYGNEVSDAVAKYRIDTAGSLYETHSPRTELPKLGSPKT